MILTLYWHWKEALSSANEQQKNFFLTQACHWRELLLITFQSIALEALSLNRYFSKTNFNIFLCLCLKQIEIQLDVWNFTSFGNKILFILSFLDVIINNFQKSWKNALSVTFEVKKIYVFWRLLAIFCWVSIYNIYKFIIPNNIENPLHY